MALSNRSERVLDWLEANATDRVRAVDVMHLSDAETAASRRSGMNYVLRGMQQRGLLCRVSGGIGRGNHTTYVLTAKGRREVAR